MAAIGKPLIQMAASRRDTRLGGSRGQTAGSSAAGAGFSPSTEEVSFCEIVNRVCPELHSEDILKHLRKEAARRQRRVRSLARRVRAAQYEVGADAVANALLVEIGAAVN